MSIAAGGLGRRIAGAFRLLLLSVAFGVAVATTSIQAAPSVHKLEDWSWSDVLDPEEYTVLMSLKEALSQRKWDFGTSWKTPLPDLALQPPGYSQSGGWPDPNSLTYELTRPARIVSMRMTLPIGIPDGSVSIPDNIGNLTQLKSLDLSYGVFGGKIPDSIGNLRNLTYLNLTVNRLTGSIPNSIANLTNLAILDLSQNKLTGTIPDGIGNLKRLNRLDLSVNKLTGSIPNGIENLTMLTHLDLAGDQLSGGIPEGIGSLTHLGYLNLSGNQLSGSIPESIGNLTRLTEFYFSNNQLSGSIPKGIGNLTKLTGFDLSNNQLSGSIPEGIGNLTMLYDLPLDGNNFSGSIPDSIGNLVRLVGIRLSNMQLSGSIPSSIGNLKNLSYLDLSTNQLSGSIPDSIGDLTRLNELDLSGNQLSGSIPASIGNLPIVYTLYLQNNQLSGIPSTFSSFLSRPTYVWLQQNNLQLAPNDIQLLKQLDAKWPWTFDFNKYIRWDSINVIARRLLPSAMTLNESDPVDSSAQPDASQSNNLASQPPLGLGVVADGVAPVLLHLSRDQGAEKAATYRLDLSVSGPWSGNVLRQRLRVLSRGSWTAAGSTVDVAIPAGQSNAFAYIEGIPMDRVSLAPSTVTVKLMDGNTQLDSTNFKVRRPPVVLVHGYNANSSTWSDAFLQALAASRGPDFVLPVNYGVSVTDNGDYDNSVNVQGSFESLAAMLHDSLRFIETDRRETSAFAQWYCLRYDVVAHSQGGVLTRMLCRRGPYDNSSRFYGPQYPRGRFHRIITIGSPHNGSVIPYYVLQLGRKNSFGDADWLWKNLPTWGRDLLQAKFLPFSLDPFANQIAPLNQQTVDERASFHLIASSLNVVPPVYSPTIEESVLGWLEPAGNGETIKEVLLPYGSDGVVDMESQFAGTGTHGTLISEDNISHAPVAGDWATRVVFGVNGFNSTQTRSAVIADKVVELLNGPSSAFGPFRNPTSLSDARQKQIDQILPTVRSVNYVDFAQKSMAAREADPAATYNFIAQIPAGEAIPGSIHWFAEVIGITNNDQSGVTVVADANDPTRASVLVEPSVVGDVVLYSRYASANGTLVLSEPLLVVSVPPASEVTGVELRPNSIPLLLSNSIPLQVWLSYANGVRRPLAVLNNPEFAFASANPSVLRVSSNGVVTAVGAGSASAQLSYQGFTASATFAVTGPPTILRQPMGQVGDAGHAITLTAGVSSSNLNFQWYHDGVAVSGATNANWTVDNAHRADGGNYTLSIFNSVSSVITSNVLVRVRVPQILQMQRLHGSTGVLLFSTDVDGEGVGKADAADFTLEYSPDLSANSWRVLPNALSLTNGALFFEDREAMNRARSFYRVIER